jgi:hypothetical protein
MLERLVVAETITQGAFQVGDCRKQPIMGRPPSQHFPKALAPLQLRIILG